MKGLSAIRRTARRDHDIIIAVVGTSDPPHRKRGHISYWRGSEAGVACSADVRFLRRKPANKRFTAP